MVCRVQFRVLANMGRSTMNARKMIQKHKDGCYAVIIGSKRGPCAHSRGEAYRRYLRSGCIAWVVASAFSLVGCAALPMNWQPKDDDSRKAEAVWDVIDTIDTVQTAKFVQTTTCHEADPMARAVYGGGNPAAARVIGTNAVLMGVHSVVSRWFDNHYDASVSADDGNAGAWYVGRIAWHVASIGASAASVIGNASTKGCH
jgi:hypothetical protein